MITPSEVVQRITGTYIEDEAAPKAPLLAWIQAECRHGCFHETVEKFAKSQPEPLRADLVLVEKFIQTELRCAFQARPATTKVTQPLR